MARRRTRAPRPTAKPQISDQAPGEEVVQVNDKYAGNGPPPDTAEPTKEQQHPTGG